MTGDAPTFERTALAWIDIANEFRSMAPPSFYTAWAWAWPDQIAID
jgi:hypothetical protein